MAPIESVKYGIKQLHTESKVNYLKTKMEGIRMDKGKAMHTHCPQVPIWREAEVRRHLHLTPKYNATVAWMSVKLLEGGLTRLSDCSKPGTT